MRAFALLLLFVNLVVLAWGLTRPAADAPAAAPASARALQFPRALQLLSEAPPPAQAPPQPAPGRAEGVRYCERVGPLPQPADASAILTRAESLGLRAQIDLQEELFGAPDFQVHLPPLPSMDQARRQVRELQALGVEAYVIERDSLARAVSVGLFTDESNASSRREEVARLGYDVRVRRLDRTRTVAYVLLGGPDLGTVEPFVASLRREWPEVAAQVADCPDLP